MKQIRHESANLKVGWTEDKAGHHTCFFQTGLLLDINEWQQSSFSTCQKLIRRDEALGLIGKGLI